MNEAKEITTENSENLIFRKVLRGFDPQEVTDYIEQLSRTMRDASKNYEVRMAEMKQELAFTVRERDTLREKCTELERSIQNTAETPEAMLSAAASADISEEWKEKLAEETSKNKDASRLLAEADKKLELLSSRLDEEEREKLALLKQTEELKKALYSQQDLRALYDANVSEKEKLQSELSNAQDEIRVMQKDIRGAEEQILKKENTISELRTEIGRAELENSLLREKAERCSKELADMKNDAKIKAYENAEKLSAEEEAFNREKTALRKQIQLQNYHIELAQTAVKELQTQLTQIRAAFDE